MSSHTYFSNQSSRPNSSTTATATTPSTTVTNTGVTSGGESAPASRPRSQSKLLSLSMEGEGTTASNGNGVNGHGNGHSGLGGEVHPLKSTWVFWFRQHRPNGTKIVSYEEGIKKISAFSSVESFWSLWTHLSPPSSLQPTTDYLIFHSAVHRPIWEDPLNINGGKWIIRLKKGVADRLWEDTVLSVIGDQFEEEDGVCGCVLSVRGQEDILSVWQRDEKDTIGKARIRDTIRRCLNLPPNTLMEYKTNNDSLQDKSSFRTLTGSTPATPA